MYILKIILLMMIVSLSMTHQMRHDVPGLRRQIAHPMDQTQGFVLHMPRYDALLLFNIIAQITRGEYYESSVRALRPEDVRL